MQIMMRSSLPFRAVLTAAALCLSAGLAAAETPAGYMQRVANELVAATRSATPVQSFATVLRSHADLPTIGLTALGSYANSLSKADRPSYYSAMVNWISRYAAKEAPKYPVARAIMVGQTTESAGVAYVDSTITLRSGTVYDVRWVIVKRGSVYKVRDAEYLGFRISSSLDNLFQNFMSENGGNPRKLILALNG